MALRISAMQRTVEQMMPLISQMVASGHIPEADWSKIRSMEFQEAMKERKSLSSLLASASTAEVTSEETFDREYRMMHVRKLLEAEISSLKMRLSDENLELLPDYQQRIEVLKKLRFIDPVLESVLLKGRVACEINSADELVLTELVLDNVFGDYSPEEVVALLSVFVFQERQPEGQESEPFKEGTKLEQGYETILKTAERVEQVQSTQRVNFDNFETKLKTGLVNVVYEWARGVVSLRRVLMRNSVLMLMNLDSPLKRLRR